jgi:hypothetical protein
MATNPNWLIQPLPLASLPLTFDGPSYTEIYNDTLGPDPNAPDGMDQPVNDSVSLAQSFQHEFDGSTFDVSDLNLAAPAVDLTDLPTIQANIEANAATSDALLNDLTGQILPDPTPVKIPTVPIIPPPSGGGGGGGEGGGGGQQCTVACECPPGFTPVHHPGDGDTCVPDFLV